MNSLNRTGSLLAVCAFLVCGPAMAQTEPLAKPADIEISVSPAAVAAGGQAEVTLRIQPIEGVKINKYPKIKLEVSAQAGLVEQGHAEIGSAKPPPPDQMATNYYKTVDPLTLALKLDAAARPGSHQIDARLTYYYCVVASGFCAPARVPVKIPVAVR